MASPLFSSTFCIISVIFRLTDLPVNSSWWIDTQVTGHSGWSAPHTASTKFFSTCRSLTPAGSRYFCLSSTVFCGTRYGSNPIMSPSLRFDFDHSNHSGSLPCLIFLSSQPSSNSIAAWVQYLPSVHMNAISWVIKHIPIYFYSYLTYLHSLKILI